MKYGCMLSRLILCAAVTCLLFATPRPGWSDWTKIDVPDYTDPLDTIWGTSDDNIYAIGFTGHVFHMDENGITDITTEVFGDKSVLITLDESNNSEDFPYSCIPFGIGGTGPDNVFLVGMEMSTDIIQSSTNNSAYESLYDATPFVMRYDGHFWNKIHLDANDVDTRYLPHTLTGICGTGPDNMYFSGWKVLKDGTGENATYSNTGVVLHLNALTGKWTGEVGVGDLVDDPETEVLSEINEITFAGDNDIYAVGLKGQILHKSLTTGMWRVMTTRSSNLFFVRVWAYDKDNVFAAGYNNSDYNAVVYRLSNDAWTSMAIPVLKQGRIPVLWGLWGETPEYIFAVGNAGATIYYDGNSGYEWYSMVSDTTTSLNGLWGTSHTSVYACAEDGNIYHYDGVIKTNAVKAYPLLSVAPETVEFTDSSPDEVVKWEWDFNDTVTQAQPPTADLDYKIFITAVQDVSLNGNRIIVLNDDAITAPHLVDVAAKSAQVDLGEKLLVTAVPGRIANGTTVYVQETSTGSENAVYQFSSYIVVKILPGATQSQVADLLTSQEIIESAVADNPGDPWFDGVDKSPTSGSLTGGASTTLRVMIDSGYTTYKEIADLLKTHPWIESAVADDPADVWIRGMEAASNVVYLSGGLEDSNHYTNTDTSIEYYYMARHKYTVAGEYTTDLTITHPKRPAKGEIIIYDHELPASIDYDQDMYIESIPGTTMNAFIVSIVDGGPGITPYLQSTETTLTAYIDSGTTLQSEVADLLTRHHHILFAQSTYPDNPWYVSAVPSSNSVRLYNGSNGGTEKSSVTVKVLANNPIDFTITPSQGVDDLWATFKAVPTDEIKGQILRWTWYFEYVNGSNPGSEEEGTLFETTNSSAVVTHHYTKLGKYNVMLEILLDNNSPFTVFKENAVLVKSSDEDRSSIEGGSGLTDVDVSSSLRGCFISSMGDGR